MKNGIYLKQWPCKNWNILREELYKRSFKREDKNLKLPCAEFLVKIMEVEVVPFVDNGGRKDALPRRGSRVQIVQKKGWDRYSGHDTFDTTK